jgi:hypothetical protein
MIMYIYNLLTSLCINTRHLFRLGWYLMISKPLRNFTRSMHMMPVFLFVSDNKKLMTVELLNGSGSCVKGRL